MVSKNAVEVNLSVNEISIHVAELGTKDMAFIKANVFSRSEKSHGDFKKTRRDC
jgi:hypothetical protein